MTAGPDAGRRLVLSRRVRLLVAGTISYNVIEAIVAVSAGVMASSTALIGFGLDSVIEVASASAVAWQFSGPDPEARERTALKIIALSFFALAGYVTVESVRSLTGAEAASHSTVGIVLAAVSLLVMPLLSYAQRSAGRELGSASAVADSRQTLLCTYLSGVLLVGLLLNSLFGWSWADPIVALIIAGWLSGKAGKHGVASTAVVSSMAADALRLAVEALRLVDHHVHGAATDEVDCAGFEAGFTESPWPPPAGTTHLDSQLGFAVRRWCAPVLELPPHTDASAYLDRRRELGAQEVTRRFLAASGIGWFLVETGYGAEQTLGPAEMAVASGAAAAEVVRLESVAEEVAASGVDAACFADRFAATLDQRSRHAVGLKSVIAYRFGLDFDSEPPSADEVCRAAGQWLRRQEAGERRLTDPVLLRHLLWVGVDRGLPLQFHVGYGDSDLTLHRCDPSLMTEFLRRIQGRRVPVMLLHCYPYHRTAGYLAHVFPHVYVDVGLVVNYTGARSRAIVAESLEVAPFGKVLFSSDAWGPAELHYLGAALWRRAMVSVLGEWVESGEWSGADAVRVAQMVGAGNAKRVYRVEE